MPKKKKKNRSLTPVRRKARRPEPYKIGKSIFIFYLFLAVALIALGFCALTSYQTYQAQTFERNVPGKVVDLVSERFTSETIYFYPVVTFERPDQGLVTVKSSEGSWPPAYEKGQDVTVIYSLRSPEKVRIKSADSDLAQWVLPIITGALGGAFLIASIVTLIILKTPPPDDKDLDEPDGFDDMKDSEDEDSRAEE